MRKSRLALMSKIKINLVVYSQESKDLHILVVFAKASIVTIAHPVVTLRHLHKPPCPSIKPCVSYCLCYGNESCI